MLEAGSCPLNAKNRLKSSQRHLELFPKVRSARGYEVVEDVGSVVSTQPAAERLVLLGVEGRLVAGDALDDIVSLVLDDGRRRRLRRREE